MSEGPIHHEMEGCEKMRVPTKLLIALAAMLAFGSTAVAQGYYNECTNAISSNFNGTAIGGGSYIWFSGVLNVKGLPSGTTEVFVSHSTITFTANGTTYAVKVPDSTVTFSPATTLATTDFTLLPPRLGYGWETNLPSSGLAGNDLMTAVHVAVPSAGLPGGIKDVVWSATFSSYTSGLTVQWQWAAAVYSTFSANYNSLGVKPVDDNKASEYKNSDHAGTPENFKEYVVGGATGGGGSNYTGSLSATASCPLSPS